MGRSTQGVKVMNLRGDDTVSAVALVQESDADIGASTGDENGNGAAPQLEVEGDESGEDADGAEPSGNGSAA
jgi:hypothetical protein